MLTEVFQRCLNIIKLKYYYYILLDKIKQKWQRRKMNFIKIFHSAFFFKYETGTFQCSFTKIYFHQILERISQRLCIYVFIHIIRFPNIKIKMEPL